MKITELNEMELMVTNGGGIGDRSRSHGHGSNCSGGHKRDCSWSNRDFSREVVKGGVTGAIGGSFAGGVGAGPGAAAGGLGGAAAAGVGYAFDRRAFKLGW